MTSGSEQSAVPLACYRAQNKSGLKTFQSFLVMETGTGEDSAARTAL